MYRLQVNPSYFVKQFRSHTSISIKASQAFRHNYSTPLNCTHSNQRTRAYATMSQSHACCTVPPIVGDDYKEKGNFTTIQDMKTYQTGSSDAKQALLVVYDIFGFFPQTLQGADILAHGDKEKPYQVFMPGQTLCMRRIQQDRLLTLLQISSTASQQTSPGTHRTLMRRARSSASSSTTKLLHRRHSVSKLEGQQARVK